MSFKELGITHKQIKPILVVYTNFRGELEDIPSKIEKLRENFKFFRSGPIIAVIDFGVYSEGGSDIDICMPIEKNYNQEGFKVKTLEEVEVLSIVHKGSYNKLSETSQKLFNYNREHAILGTTKIRLIFPDSNKLESDKNKLEIQGILHQWDMRLRKNLDRVLGDKEKSKNIMKNEALFRLDSSKDEKTQWVKDVLKELDKVADSNQKYEILSNCAHEFSQKRIDKLREIYIKTGNIDMVLEKIHDDYLWYENPTRKGNVIYTTKIPYNLEGYKNAKTLDEKKRNYCHCSLVRDHWDEGISATFCNCSAGWYRQIWEGILKKPVRIEILKTLLKGDDTCEFAIHLPLDVKII
jgi:effector-binding domain-containing protein